MKNLQNIVRGYGSKMQGGACCNGTPLMNQWMFGNGDLVPVEDCCGDLTGDEPVFADAFDGGYSGQVTTDSYFFPARICRISVTFTNVISNMVPVDSDLRIKIFINGTSYFLTPNGSNTFFIDAGDEIHFGAETAGGEYQPCHDIKISMVNNTCGVAYNNISHMFLNGTPDCVSCPFVIPDVVDDKDYYLIGPYTNTTPYQIYYAFNNAIPIIFNPTTTISVYFGTNPTYNLNPYFDFVVGGVFTGCPNVYLNPGEKMWIYTNVLNLAPSEYQVLIDLVTDCQTFSIEPTIRLNP